MSETPDTEFGFYAPKPSWVMTLLQLARESGVSRGKIRKAVARQWARLGYTIVDAEVRGVRYRLHIASNTTDGKVLTSSKFYDRQEITALMRFCDGDNAFVDVGANTGYYSLNIAKSCDCRIVAVEPNPVTLDILSFNVGANGFGDKISISPFCIGDGADVALYCAGGLGDANVFGGKDDVAPVMVPSKPLLDIVKQENIEKIGGMKLDIEGFEDRALRPFFDEAPRSLYPKVIVIEVCGRRFWESDIIEEMKSLGYASVAETRGNQILKLTGK